MSALPPAILICTHARTLQLQEALFCALNQSMPCDVLISNDCPEQTLETSEPRCTIFNHTTRFETLGAKRNDLLRRAADAGYTESCWLDDDDVATPDFVEHFRRLWQESGGGSIILNARGNLLLGRPGVDSLKFHPESDCFRACYFAPESAWSTGGYGNEDAWADTVFFHNAAKAGKLRTHGQCGYIYRRQTGLVTLSEQDEVQAAQLWLEDADRRLQDGSEPTGRIMIGAKRPAW